MNRFEQDRLLNEVLEGGELSELRRASLENGLAVIRCSRRRARVLSVCALLILPIALFAALVLRRTETAELRQAASVTTQTAARAAGAIKFINDEELLALFPGRPVALVGKPGEQQLVFLDQPYGRAARPSRAIR